MKQRPLCRVRGCKTRVSVHNPDIYCWVHQRDRMSAKFIANVRGAYTFPRGGGRQQTNS